MLELLSPAGSPEGVVAAVQNGADAVYLGFGDYNARRNAKNFTEEELYKAAEYCRVRGVKVYVTLNTLASDRELTQVASAAKTACRCGADAILVQDLGVLRAVRESVPEVAVHASTQMSLHDLDGVRMAAAMGLTRAVLARELSREDIAYICERSPIEIEVFGHGALCMCYSGQCYMSAVIGRRSGNRGLCAQPCRLPYSGGGRGNAYPLSLKDNCLVAELEALEKMGVACLKIEGRMRRPEYAAIVTGIYSRAIREKRLPAPEDMEALKTAFSRQGFTDGYYTGKLGPDMFGVREDADKKEYAIFSAARKHYLNSEYQRVPVQFVGIVREGNPARLYARDDRGNRAVIEGATPEPAFHRELTPTAFQTQLYKTGGTPFFCDGAKSSVDSGLSLPAAAINDMRRTLLAELQEKRKVLPERQEGNYTLPEPAPNRAEAPILTISVLRAEQLSKSMAEVDPYLLYIPLEEIAGNEKKLAPFLLNDATTVAAILPRIIHDDEVDNVVKMLEQAKRLGIREVLAGNVGHILFAREQGFAVRGDFGLNIYNSEALAVCRDLGLKSATLSFEMRMEQIRDISKSLDTELIVYGRLPLMVMENCIVKNSAGVCACDTFSGLTDKSGFSFPVVRAFGCRNVLLNSKKLFLADRAADYMHAGLWGVRLSFTTENAIECAAVTERYLNKNDYEPNAFTRGLYYRGVE